MKQMIGIFTSILMVCCSLALVWLFTTAPDMEAVSEDLRYYKSRYNSSLDYNTLTESSATVNTSSGNSIYGSASVELTSSNRNLIDYSNNITLFNSSECTVRNAYNVELNYCNQVSVDGNYKGATPLTLSYCEGGHYEFREGKWMVRKGSGSEWIEAIINMKKEEFVPNETRDATVAPVNGEGNTVIEDTANYQMHYSNFNGVFLDACSECSAKFYMNPEPPMTYYHGGNVRHCIHNKPKQ